MNDDLEEETESFKIVLIGESGVGKTSIISQFMDHVFQPQLTMSTSASYSSNCLLLNDGSELKLDIWDTAGQEKYRAMTKMFYKDSNAAILVYDITRQDSFDVLSKYWIDQLKENSSSNIILAIAANKSDLIEEEKVNEETARKFAQENNAIFCQTSAKTSFGINDLFFEIAKKYTGKDIMKIKNEENIGKITNKNENGNNKNETMKITKEKTKNKNKKKRCC